MSTITDVAQLLATATTTVVAVAGLLRASSADRHARQAEHHAHRADIALNGRPAGATVSDDVASIERRGVRDDLRRGSDPDDVDSDVDHPQGDP